ncbi:MAG: NYN domain-containing protein [Peptococcaceae bacterium]|jgi:uncharacterized LabA/DUF88 family protein|nr:NYN domain-containing protein [Peptococcaceae bacterium]
MSDRIAIFIDGGYLDKILELRFSRVHIDYNKLSSWMSRECDILRTYYYTCLPYKNSDNPTPEQEERYNNKQKFHYALNSLPRFTVRVGKLKLKGFDIATRQPIFEQKGVDIMLCIDMISLALKNKVTHIALLASDGDFLPVIEAVRNEGVVTYLYHSDYRDFSRQVVLTPSKYLISAVDERFTIDQTVINSILRQPREILLQR